MLIPKRLPPASTFMQDDVVGADASATGQGQQDLRRLGQGPDADDPPDVAERDVRVDSLDAVVRGGPGELPYSSTGLNTYPAAGPYYIASRDPGRSTVLKRNPYYKGNRPANPDQIVFTPNVNRDQSLFR